MIDDAGVPSEYLEWHGHNDFHKGVHQCHHGLALWMCGGQWDAVWVLESGPGIRPSRD